MDDPTIRDVDVAMLDVDRDAHISRLACIGAPAEWRDRPSHFPAKVMRGAIIREFVRVHAGCERPTVIGENVLLMAGSHVGHDSRIGPGTEIAPNAVVGGCCTIGQRVKIGMGAVILPGRSIGDSARIGAGAVVTKDVPAGETWIGNPARLMQ